MAKRFKLKEVQEQKGDLGTVIPDLLKAHNGSQKDVAEELGVTQATISNWLKENDFIQVKQWVKRETA